MPFSASVDVVEKRSLTDGSFQSDHAIIHIARNSAGVIYTERRRREPLNFRGEFELLRFEIFDHQKHIRTTLFPLTHVARQSVTSEQSVPVAATFLSKRRHVPGATNDEEQEISIGDEYVYNEDFGVYLLLSHSDPRTGVWSVNTQIVKAKKKEPNPRIFEIPRDYKIVAKTQKH